MSEEVVNAKRYSAGIATAYGAAKKGGYTGTYEQFCAEQAMFAENAQYVRQSREIIESTVQTFTTETVPAAVQNVENAGDEQQRLVRQTGAEVIQDVEAAGDQQMGRIEQAMSPYIAQAEQAVDDARAAKDDARAAKDDAVSAKEAAEAAEEHAAESEAHAQELVDSLPSDYADALLDIVKLQLLSDSVMDTTQKFTYSADGKVITQVTHVNANNVAVRTDVYTYGETQIVEKRTLNTGANVTITTNLANLETSVVFAAA